MSVLNCSPEDYNTAVAVGDEKLVPIVAPRYLVHLNINDIH